MQAKEERESMTKQPPSEENIYLDILDRIIKLELEPGSQISENMIAEEYGVSRSVIRNVFTRLKQMGFLTVYPQRGTFVNKINTEYIMTVLLLRTAIEKEMLYRLIKSEDKSDIIQKMEENLKLQEQYCDFTEYIEGFKELDEEFHDYIMSAENKNILSIISGHLLHISRWRNVYIKSGHTVCSLINEHRLILQAIKNNDLGLAMDSMSKHIHTIADIMEFKGEHADYFE